MRKVKEILEELIVRYPALEGCKGAIVQTFETIAESYRRGGVLYLCGNGGSAADCEHIVGELMKGFLLGRPLREDEAAQFAHFGEEGKVLAKGLQRALPAVSLTSHIALSTAFSNDCDPMLTFAQQVYGLGKPGDVLLAISTSGNSRNCCYAALAAKAKGMKVVALTGSRGGRIADEAEAAICVPETETFKVQEMHLPVYHCLCAMLESEFFG